MFTDDLEQLRHAIAPGARSSGTCSYPRNLSLGAVRRSDNEAAHIWLKRCADHFEGDTWSFVVDECIALFFIIEWQEKTITYANLQALWVPDVTIEDFVNGAGTERHRYLRLDYDLQALGLLLKEPQPHVHVEADGEPRFLIPAAVGDDVVGWFLDFVYRNFRYEDWIEWVRGIWHSYCLERRRENRWEMLVNAFSASNLGAIEANVALRGDLQDLKACLLAERKKLFPLTIDAKRAELLSHDT